MPTLKLKEHLSQSELKQRLNSATDIRLFKQWQILHAVACNVAPNAEAIALLLGTTANIVRRHVRAYNKNGPGHLASLKWGGRRQARSLLTREQEAALLESVSESSLNGSILTAKDIREKVESAVGRGVSDDYLWDLFKRHGWKKKAPRPKHPLQDPDAQELFKKNSQTFWQRAL